MTEAASFFCRVHEEGNLTWSPLHPAGKDGRAQRAPVGLKGSDQCHSQSRRPFKVSPGLSASAKAVVGARSWTSLLCPCLVATGLCLNLVALAGPDPDLSIDFPIGFIPASLPWTLR